MTRFITSIGQGLPSTILEVIDKAGDPVGPGSGDVGEIVATGDNVTAGYWRDPETTARYFDGGRLRTRDLATVDEDGFIYLVDRAKDVIKSGGEWISSMDLENAAFSHPGVAEAAVSSAAEAAAAAASSQSTGVCCCGGSAVALLSVITRPRTMTS